MLPTIEPVVKKKDTVTDMLNISNTMSASSSKKGFSYASEKESNSKASKPVRANSQIKPPNLRSNSAK